MEFSLAIQLTIITGIFTVISGALILYFRKWHFYWRQVFLISAMEKQRSGGEQRSGEVGQGLEGTGAPYWFAISAPCCALIMLTYETVFKAAAIIFSLMNSLYLRVSLPGT